MGEKDGTKPKANVTAVYKINEYCTCDSCVKKIKDEIKDYEGVEELKIDWESIILTVIGKVDPDKLRNKLAEKTNKKIDLICTQTIPPPPPPSPPPPQPPAPKECMLDLKITPYCDGCMRNLRKVILEFDGCKSYCQGCKSYCQGCSTCQEARKKGH